MSAKTTSKNPSGSNRGRRTREASSSSVLQLIGPRGDAREFAVTKHNLLGRRSHSHTNTELWM